MCVLLNFDLEGAWGGVCGPGASGDPLLGVRLTTGPLEIGKWN